MSCFFFVLLEEILMQLDGALAVQLRLCADGGGSSPKTAMANRRTGRRPPSGQPARLPAVMRAW